MHKQEINKRGRKQIKIICYPLRKKFSVSLLTTFIFLLTAFQSANAGGIPDTLSGMLSILNPKIQGKVIRVLDGDTIEVLQDKKPVRIRLANIDAPEKKQAFGRWSANQLKALLAAQPVTVTYTQTDRYGRIIGRVFTTNGTDASRFMVQSGAAWVYERYNTDKSLPALQREAQEQKRGLWADANPVPPWEWRIRN
ncbi:thermonuclease family protein [Escherichia coli]